MVIFKYRKWIFVFFYWLLFYVILTWLLKYHYVLENNSYILFGQLYILNLFNDSIDANGMIFFFNFIKLQKSKFSQKNFLFNLLLNFYFKISIIRSSWSKWLKYVNSIYIYMVYFSLIYYSHISSCRACDLSTIIFNFIIYIDNYRHSELTQIK